VIEHVAGVHWNSFLMCRGICHSEKGYTRQPISADELFRFSAQRLWLRRLVTFGFSANPIPYTEARRPT